ncbi:MAG: metallo-beta-lactamase family protein RNA-specific [Chitinophagaceae bacterium]|nr:metallo-beta-lactamase family protein RNA-specific [Chitinophagaceae bacterium]
MKISFHGAAQTVTGSKHLLTLDNGKNILLDCGMFQGMGKDTDTLNATFGFDASTVDVMVLSHAHIDHTGLIPKLVKEGFKGKIFCTPATRELANILLLDSAEIQRDDTKFGNKRRAKQGLPPLEPLYSVDDAKACADHFEEVGYGNWVSIIEGVEVMFTDAGHIIGSAAVHLRIQENNKQTTLTFSGDVGRYRDVILKSPEVFPQADHIIIESTYGNSRHEAVYDTEDRLLFWVEKTCVEKRGKLIIPAFSVGRTQEVLYFLNLLYNEKKLPNVKVYVDSPLSLEATEIVKKHTENFNKRLQRLLQTDDDPFGFPTVTYIQSADESKELNLHPEPCIIISASGMADAGRVKHHIRNNISDNKNTILLVGYCEPRSLGGRLMAGVKEVKIFGEEFNVVAEIGSIRSMSAHGDYDDLCQFLACQHEEAVKTLFIVHGEYNVQQDFQKSLQKKGYKQVEVPAMHETFKL